MTQRVRRPAAQGFAVAAVVGVAVLTGCSAAPSTHPAGAASAPASPGGWGIAQEVPGTAALSQNEGAEINSVSCASAGNCSAGGHYNDGGFPHAFVVSEVNGTWHQAEKVPGIAALSQFGSGQFGSDAIDSVSCASAGNCSAGGDYFDSSGHQQVFVVSEVSGTWQRAEAVPGIATLNQGGQGSPAQALINSVSCASAGNCSAGGYYTDRSGDTRAFVVSQTGGTWHQAEEVPGTATLSDGGFGKAEISSVSCPSAGNCTAGGHYGGAFSSQAFVVSEVDGTWQQAEKVPSAPAFSQDGSTAIYSVSCASAGNCTAGGSYANISQVSQAFVVSEVKGTWQQAQVVHVPGDATPTNAGGPAISSLSCPSAGNCTAGGAYTVGVTSQAFVVSEVNGTWQRAQVVHVPGTAKLYERSVSSVSCASAGNCSAGVIYSDHDQHNEAFVISEVNGTWQQAGEVPGTATRGKNAVPNSVSCASAGICTAGGYYTDGRGNQQAFVVSQT
jgi:hypothetical protein